MHINVNGPGRAIGPFSLGQRAGVSRLARQRPGVSRAGVGVGERATYHGSAES